MSVDWRALYASGELQRIAATCSTRDGMAARVGTSVGNLKKKLWGLGTSFEKLRATAEGVDVDVDVSDLFDFSDEEPTEPNSRAGQFEAQSAESSRPGIIPLLPPDHRYSGVSTLLDAGGNVRLQWQKTSVSREQYREALLLAVTEIAEPFRGTHEPVEQAAPSNADLLAVYTIGDAHLGMLSHADETGTNHDLKRGESDLVAAIDHLVGVAPDAESAVVLSLGDFVHFDNESGTTTKGTRQDADTRWYKVMRTSIRAARRCIEAALRKHAHVRGIFIRGNHDKHASAAVALALAGYYEREPRVTIDTSPDPYSWIRFGRVLIGANHSEEASKADVLAGVMACDRAEDWGACPHRYMLCGHLHHTFAKEEMGVLVERFPTLAPQDAYHHAHGYRAQQSMCVDTYHREWGRVNRSTVGIRQLRAS